MIALNFPNAPFSTAQSLRNEAFRDVAWGRAKADNIDAAMAHVEMITTPRERIAALAHVARMVDDAKMKSLPRYL